VRLPEIVVVFAGCETTQTVVVTRVRRGHDGALCSR
jgi:hypothetical protein